jgi:F-type H+-transporting ATPase subunit b
MATQVVAAGNFLVPNATFIAELVAFLIILFVLWRYIVPPIQKVMQDRQRMIEKQAEDSEKAEQRLAEAEKAYQNALSEARTEAAQIRENARAEAQRVVEDLREQAQQEQARIIARGDEHLERQRASIVRELRTEIGTLAVELSEKIVGQQLSSDAEVRSTVDSFIAGLEAQETAGETAGDRARAGS